MLRKLPPLTWFAILFVLAIALALGLPPNPDTLQNLHISAVEYRAAVFTLVLPYGVIWFSAFYAFDQLERYTRKVQTSREGTAFKRIADGIGILAWGLAVPTILAMLFGVIAMHFPGFASARTIIDTYLNLLPPLVGFAFIGNGTRSLTDSVRLRPGRDKVRALLLLFIAVGVLFVHSVLRNQYVGINPYDMPVYILMLTVIVPYLFAWFMGVLAAGELRLYARKIRGVLYQRALNFLAGGLGVVVLASITLQYQAAIFANRSDVSLGAFLIFLYSLLSIQAVGYVLIALGANRLKRIEEV